MQPPFQARTHALRMRPIHLMHRYRYLSLATEFLHAGLFDVNVRCDLRKQRRRVYVGERVDTTEWVTVPVWGQPVESAGKPLSAARLGATPMSSVTVSFLLALSGGPFVGSVYEKSGLPCDP